MVGDVAVPTLTVCDLSLRKLCIQGMRSGVMLRCWSFFFYLMLLDCAECETEVGEEDSDEVVR